MSKLDRLRAMRESGVLPSAVERDGLTVKTTYDTPFGKLTTKRVSVTPSRYTVTRDTVTRSHCPTCTCEGLKVHGSHAERQRAYRRRKAKQ